MLCKGSIAMLVLLVRSELESVLLNLPNKFLIVAETPPACSLTSIKLDSGGDSGGMAGSMYANL